MEYGKSILNEELLVGGIKVNYYFHCKRQLWLYAHFITYEHESDLVELGKLISEKSFKEIKAKDIIIDGKISVDIIRREGKIVIYEIKKSSKFGIAHYHQLLYYLWYLKKKGVETEGILSYPEERKKIKVILTENKEKEMERILQDINKIVSLEKPPKMERKRYCYKCSYFEFCWAE